MSLAWPSFCSMPSTISQQSLAPGVAHIFGAVSVLKMRHALMLLPSKRDFHGPAFGAAGCNTRAKSSTAIVWVIAGRYIMTGAKGGRHGRQDEGRFTAPV